jgi:L-lactate dehydrogenase complex protein LldG
MKTESVMKRSICELSRSAEHREAIFEDIKSAKSTPNQTSSRKQVESEAQALLENYTLDRPILLSEEPVDELIRRISSGLIIGTTVERVNRIELLPKAVGRFLTEHNLAKTISVQPIELLTQLSWGDIGLLANVGDENSVSVCIADLGIAETGSVVIHSGKTMPVLMNFLPTYQIIAVGTSTILRYLEDYSGIALGLFGANKSPRNTTFITGASGTTDIEGELVQGAHGPRLVHIICLDDQ